MRSSSRLPTVTGCDGSILAQPVRAESSALSSGGKETTDVRTLAIEDLRERLDSGRPLEFWNVQTDKWFTGEIIPGSRRVLPAVTRVLDSAQLRQTDREMAARRDIRSDISLA